MYYRGTLADFNSWHTDAKTAKGITGDGIVGCINGNPDETKQKTTEFSVAVQHPDKTDDYIWIHEDQTIEGKTSYSLQDVQGFGWFIWKGYGSE